MTLLLLIHTNFWSWRHIICCWKITKEGKKISQRENFFTCIKIFLYVYISISDDKIKANKAKTIPECQFTRLVSHQRHMDEKTKEIIRSLLYNQWQQRSSDQQLLPTLTRCIRKREKKLTLVNQDCLIPTASFLKLDSHSRVSPTHTHIVLLLGSRP